ncbi:hypothetical protein ILUMI_25996 [Ignelater luminosus]|uniref:J domain-containing protein n=1 Tax=Ignelater luminosus TaxID=2038154 RepID=A0A8K0CAL9_IGNLU|nr:hypothetical protein ILUMI_25996 [Ignelater luminosus]
MSDLLEKCEEYFNTRDFYEVLKVEKKASLKEIKKAYYKLSLLVHPDRVEEARKAVATEKFKILGKIHSVLQDPNKRKVYDDCGDFDEELESLNNWMDYWRAMFKKISTKDIDNYKKEYIGSETEIYDIKRAYVGSKGSMDRILEMVPFSECDSEPRIIEIVREMVNNGEVEEYSCFFNEPQKNKNKRRRKWEQEKKEAEELNISDDDIALQIQKQQEKREKHMDDFMKQLEAKYSGDGKTKKRKSLKNSTEEDASNKNKRTTRSRK